MKKKKIISTMLTACTISSMAFTAMPTATLAATGSDTVTSTKQFQKVDYQNDASDNLVIIYKKDIKNQIADTGLKTNDISQATSLSNKMDIIKPRKNDKNIMEQLKSSDAVDSVFHDAKVHLQGLPNDVDGNVKSINGKAYQMVGADKTWQDKTETPTKVAVIDSGIDADTTDLNDRADAAIEEDKESASNADATHGTQVASIIAAKPNNKMGIAGFTGDNNVTVVPYRAGGEKDDKNDIYISSALNALNDISQRDDIDVVNMSFDFDQKSIDLNDDDFSQIKNAFQDAIDKLHQKNVTCVASAGNNTSIAKEDVDKQVPATLDHVISVGSCRTDGKLSDFSLSGKTTDIYAPAGDFAKDESLAVIGTDNKIESSQGTSFAAPMVSAAVASMKSVDHSLTPDQIEATLKRTATKPATIPILNTNASIKAISQSTDATEDTKKDSLNTNPKNDNIAKTDDKAIETDTQVTPDAANEDAQNNIDENEINKIIDAINKLNQKDQLTASDDAEIEKIRQAYNALSPEEKKLIPNINVLKDAENRFASDKNASVNQPKAKLNSQTQDTDNPHTGLEAHINYAIASLSMSLLAIVGLIGIKIKNIIEKEE